MIKNMLYKIGLALIKHGIVDIFMLFALGVFVCFIIPKNYDFKKINYFFLCLHWRMLL